VIRFWPECVYLRNVIRERVLAGMARAKVTGTKSGKAIGRPRTPEGTRQAIRAAHRAGGISLRQLAKRFGVGPETVRRILQD
jgi:DNA invertase Pin-like site-specific DNA recombinase